MHLIFKGATVQIVFVSCQPNTESSSLISVFIICYSAVEVALCMDMNTFSGIDNVGI